MSIYREPEKLSAYITIWLQEKIRDSGANGAVLGISGGIDSSVLAALLSRAIGADRVLGVVMPCYSSPVDEEYAMLLSETFGINTSKVDLSGAYDSMVAAVESCGEKLSEMAAANIKPRLRMSVLYSLALQRGLLVCGGSNKDEIMFGYFTKHGDSGVDLLPMADLLKGEVRLLAQYLGVPQVIIDRPPTAGLWEGQTDEKEMGLTYDELDNYLAQKNVSYSAREKIEKAVLRSEHKRKFPPAAVIPDNYL